MNRKKRPARTLARILAELMIVLVIGYAISAAGQFVRNVVADDKDSQADVFLDAIPPVIMLLAVPFVLRAFMAVTHRVRHPRAAPS